MKIVYFILIFAMIIADVAFIHTILNQIMTIASPKGGMVYKFFSSGSVNVYSYIKIYFIISSASWALLTYTKGIYIICAILIIKIFLLAVPIFSGSGMMQEW